MSTPVVQPPPGMPANTNLLDLPVDQGVPSQAKMNQAFLSVGQPDPPMAHSQAANPSDIRVPSMPGSFLRHDMPQESAGPSADQGLMHDGRFQGIPAHPRGADGQTIPTSRWIAATQSYARTQPGAKNQMSSPFDEYKLGYQTPNVRPTERPQEIDLSPPPARFPGRFNSYDQNLPYDRVLGRPASWEITYKDNKDLSKFDATITNYEEWGITKGW